VQLINRELQNSGQKLQAKAEELIRYRKTQKNIELAVETLSLCLPGICYFHLQVTCNCFCLDSAEQSTKNWFENYKKKQFAFLPGASNKLVE